MNNVSLAKGLDVTKSPRIMQVCTLYVRFERAYQNHGYQAIKYYRLDRRQDKPQFDAQSNAQINVFVTN